MVSQPLIQIRVQGKKSPSPCDDSTGENGNTTANGDSTGNGKPQQATKPEETTSSNGNPGLPGTSAQNVIVFHGADGKDGSNGQNGNVHPHDEPNVPHIPWPETYHNDTDAPHVEENHVEEHHGKEVDDEENLEELVLGSKVILIVQ